MDTAVSSTLGYGNARCQTPPPARTDADADQQPRNPTRWVGLSADDRRADRRELLIDAAFELLGTEGWAGTTVRAVCQAARLNPRYFYESFEDLDGLVVAVYDRLVAQLGEEVMAAVLAAGDDARAQTRAAVSRIVAFVDEDRRRARVLYVEALGNEALNRRRLETAHQLVTAVELAAVERHGPLPAGEHIGRIGAAVLVGGAGELIVVLARRPHQGVAGPAGRRRAPRSSWPSAKPPRASPPAALPSPAGLPGSGGRSGPAPQLAAAGWLTSCHLRRRPRLHRRLRRRSPRSRRRGSRPRGMSTRSSRGAIIT